MIHIRPIDEIQALLRVANRTPGEAARLIGVQDIFQLSAEQLEQARRVLRPLCVDRMAARYRLDRERVVWTEPGFALAMAAWGWPWAGPKPKAGDVPESLEGEK